MRLNSAEIQRIYESMKWINDKGNIKDRDFISAFEKINELRSKKASHYSLCAVFSKNERSKRYADMSPPAFAYIEKRIQEGHKNTYHSIMAVLENYRKRIDSADELCDKKSLIYDDYIHKYHIKDSDIAVFDEIFDTAFSNSLSKIV